MPYCHRCRKPMKEGFKDLKVKENSTAVTVKNVPMLLCSCGEARMKGSVAKYVHHLVNEFTKIQHSSKKFRKPLKIKEIALSI